MGEFRTTNLVPAAVRYCFEPIDLESDMFNLGMDEVFALLALREDSEGVNTQFITIRLD
ncbi:MAG: hypothetical protein ACLUPK_07840 [Veillonella sp.]